MASAGYQAEFEKGAGTIFAVFEKTQDDWLLLRLRIESPQLMDDPSQFREGVELFVENSEPVLPGAMIDILNQDTEPPTVAVGNVEVLNVRWKVVDPSSKPTYPAAGFVTIRVTNDQASKLKSVKAISIKAH